MVVTLEDLKEGIRENWAYIQEYFNYLDPSLNRFLKEHFQTPEDLEKFFEEIWQTEKVKKFFLDVFEEIEKEMKKEE